MKKVFWLTVLIVGLFIHFLIAQWYNQSTAAAIYLSTILWILLKDERI